jgi:4-hydroxy-tetrahydrodipicolinate synthase
MTPFRGLSAFPITPTDAHGRVDTEALDHLLERLHAAGADSIGLLGSTGGYMYLTREERRRAIAAAARSVGGRTPLIVGVGALRTDEAENLARDAASEGADALLLAPVSYTPLTEEVYQHFAAVAAATDLPLCVYNNPGTTHFTFSDALLRRLASVSNIRAVKMPLPKDMDFKAELGRLRQDTPDEFAVGYSGDWGRPMRCSPVRTPGTASSVVFCRNLPSGWFGRPRLVTWPRCSASTAIASRCGNCSRSSAASV